MRLEDVMAEIGGWALWRERVDKILNDLGDSAEDTDLRGHSNKEWRDRVDGILDDTSETIREMDAELSALKKRIAWLERCSDGPQVDFHSLLDRVAKLEQSSTQKGLGVYRPEEDPDLPSLRHLPEEPERVRCCQCGLVDPRKTEAMAEEAECVTMFLNDNGTPKFNNDGIGFSLVGRVQAFAERIMESSVKRGTCGECRYGVRYDDFHCVNKETVKGASGVAHIDVSRDMSCPRWEPKP